MPIIAIYTLLVFLLFIHLLEELKTGFRLKFPLGEIPLWLFVTLNVIIYSLCIVLFFQLKRSLESTVLYLWIFVAAMLLNAAGHIAMTIAKRKYFPGVFTSLLILPVSVYFIILLISR